MSLAVKEQPRRRTEAQVGVNERDAERPAASPATRHARWWCRLHGDSGRRAGMLFSASARSFLTHRPPAVPMASPSAVLAVVRTARPALRNSADALVFALHASLSCEGFVLVATGEEAQRDLLGDSLHEAPVAGWNSLPDEYAFRYTSEAAFPRGGRQYLLKALALGSKLLVDVAAPAPAPTAHLELRRASQGRWVWPCFAMLTRVAAHRVSDFTTGKLEGDYQSVYVNLGSLVSRMKEVLLPALTGQASSGNSILAAGAAQQPGRAGIAAEPRGCAPPECIAGWASPDTHAFRIRRPPSQWPDMRGVGDEDRFPHGLPVLPALGPFGPGTGGGGMLVGPHHPGFHEPPNHIGPRPPGMPPEARFDPFGTCLPNAVQRAAF